MTREQVVAYVLDAAEDDGPESYEEAAEMFRAIYDRDPDVADGDAGQLWSLVCAGVTS